MELLLEKILNFDNKRIDPTIINHEQVKKIVEHLLTTITENIPGDVVEFGCYVGESSKFLMKTIIETNSNKKLYVYDSFEGLPDLSEWEQNTGWTPRTLKTKREVLEQNFSVNGLPIPFIHKNWFRDIPNQNLPERISFAFLDGDFYESIYDSLTKIFDRVEDGGYILFHDYNRNDLPGVRAALNKFLEERNLENTTVEVVEQLGVYKKPAGVAKIETVNKINKVTEDLTVVSGLWNIGREGRDFDHYIENFKRFLDIPVNMFLYLPKELEYLVWQNPNRNKKNTHVRIFELSDIKNNLYSPFWDRTHSIRTSESWLNKTGDSGWLKNSPQAKNEWYNPVVQSKMFMLHDAKVMNIFNTNYLIWLDAGITNTVYEKYFTDNRCLDKIIPHLETFLFLSYPYITNDEIHGFDLKQMNSIAKKQVKYVCRGGLFGGHRDFISDANSMYYSILDLSLSHNLMGTEESIFSIMANLEPNKYRRYSLDENGLIIKFIQALLDDVVELEPIDSNIKNVFRKPYNRNIDKTSLYVLSFNFPEQFETLLKSFENHPDFIERPEKFLINNSTDRDTYDAYNTLCKRYGFEHIETGTNLGINRGRYYAAKHFHERGNKYYYFFEDDMCLHEKNVGLSCRNGFKTYIPNLFDATHEIVAKENLDFLKLSYTEVYMDNNIQVSWYNVPQSIRSELWPDYDQLPLTGLDPNAPRVKFDRIETHNGISYAIGHVYYANWPMLVSREGNYKMFLNTTWNNPFEQTWMSYMFQETIKGDLTPGVLLASPINHNRISHYSPDVRREN